VGTDLQGSEAPLSGGPTSSRQLRNIRRYVRTAAFVS